MSTPPSACPAWCTTDHKHPDADSLHRTTHMAAVNALWINDGLVSTRAFWSGYDHTAPGVFVSLSTGTGVLAGVKSTDGLADLVELLADATPDQHRQLAAHVREAADAITKGSAS